MNKDLKRILLKPMDFLYKINPELELKIMYRIQTGEKLSLENPESFNEKLQWLKLYYRNPLMPKLVDKYTVREYIKHKKFDYILSDLLWQGFNPEEIPFDELPEQFVIKATHGQGFNVICTDKSKLDYKKTINQLKKWLRTKFLPSYGEWFYDIERPRIVVEEFLSGTDGKVPEDYKVFCFDGTAKYIIVDTDRFETHKRTVYDTQWNYKENYKFEPPIDKPIKKPACLDEMLNIAEKLSEGFPHVRVDFYIIENSIYFGEMTFTNGAGFSKIYPKEFNLELGSYIKIPTRN